MDVADMPTLNATLSGCSVLLLLGGYIAVRRRRLRLHRGLMICALTTSSLFLVSYLTFHALVGGSIHYPRHDWTRIVYFVILFPHMILATLMVPFILWGVWNAAHRRFDRHARVMRWVWPVWMYVSVTGVLVYGMLYRFAGATIP